MFILCIVNDSHILTLPIDAQFYIAALALSNFSLVFLQ
jgi:hypothetical protein